MSDMASRPPSTGLDSPILLEVDDIRVSFKLPRKSIRQWTRQSLTAVAGVSLAVRRGETLSIVGESGSGKSTTGRAILQLPAPTSGSVRFDGVDLATLPRAAMRDMRRRMQMVFQDPFASVNRRMKVGEIIAEPMVVHEMYSGAARRERVDELMALVGLKPEWQSRFPHEFSGGQLQRVGIARALAVGPDFIVADEPVSALDVSVQAQVINLLQRLQRELGLTLLVIAHDLSVVRHLSDRVAVMYLGRIVELADCDTLYARPRHPYTKALLSAIPVPDPKIEARRSPIILEGEIPSPVSPPSGCVFRTRCWKAQPQCAAESPPLVQLSAQGWAACHYPEPGAPDPTPMTGTPHQPAT